MSLQIYTNQFSILAQNHLAFADKGVTKSIERLSSGLRINHAADDASGLTVSDELRGQINGQFRASLNAQDAISYLQTAESGMEVVTDIIQRMRELAVQASNSTYTSNDRRTLQKEIDQLKGEIDKISQNTEFNARKLLNGSTSGLWSSNTKNIEAVFTGSPAEGEYKIDFSVAPGQNAVYMTNILFDANRYQTVYSGGDPVLSQEVHYTNSTGTGSVSSSAYGVQDGTMIVNTPSDRGDFQAIDDGDAGLAAGIKNIKVNGDIDILYSAELTFNPNKPALQYESGGMKLVGFHSDYGNTQYEWMNRFALQGSSTRSGYLEIEFTMDTIRPGQGQDNTPMAATFTFVDSLTGERSTVAANYTNGGGRGADINFGNGVHLITNSWSPLEIHAGDKMLFVVQRNDNPSGADGTYATLGVLSNVMTRSGTGSGDKYTMTDALAIQTGPSVWIPDGKKVGNALTGVSLIDGEFVESHVSWEVAAGGIKQGQTVRLPDEFTSPIVATIPNPGDFTLDSISEFYTTDGHFTLTTSQTITIYGNDKKADIFLEKSDTLKDLVNKLSDALINKLDMGVPGVLNSDLVRIVTAATSGNMSVLGTIVFQSALIGTASEIRFAGDEGVLNALGISTIQEAKNNEVRAIVSDARSGQYIGSDIVSDQMLRGVIDGVNVKVKSPIGVTPTYNADNGNIIFSANRLATAFLHIASNSTFTTIAGNEGQTFDISIGRMDTHALDIDNAYVLTSKDAQQAISKFENALTRVSTIRATIGAKINHLDYTMKNLSATRNNMRTSEARIRNLDVANESTALARNQILRSAATSVLVQANQVPSAAMELISSIK